ncbi:DUF7601 domain-containing protein [Clostridium vitabionis]|uniref:DUF7601 domain-containing protein n=1 Tax=Clostridium vitabionis TaxID=2784388 RepID=UPI00188A9AD7|nr:hypothetical protein [Clostridium vitabionis]
MKKRNIKTLVTGFVLAAAMAVTPIMAMAATEDPTGVTEAPSTTPENTAGIPIKKTVHIADHTTISNEADTYTFTFTQVENVDGITSPTTGITFTKTIDSVVLDPENLDDKSYKTDGKSVYDNVDNVGNVDTFSLSVDLANAIAGEYTFAITETAPAASTGEFGWTSVDSKTFYAHVIKNTSGTLYYYLTAENKAVSASNPKLEVADFENTYTDKGNKNGGSSLVIGKDVIDEAQITDLNDTFTLKIDFTFPDTATEDQKSFLGTVTDGGPNQLESVSIDANTKSVTVELKRNGRVTFTDVPSGTTYKVSETAMSRANNYKYKNTAVKVGGSDPTQFEEETGSTSHAVDTDGVNEAIVNNTAKSVSQTGVFLSNMPFIVMMAAAAAAIFGYVALKRKISK